MLVGQKETFLPASPASVPWRLQLPPALPALGQPGAPCMRRDIRQQHAPATLQTKGSSKQLLRCRQGSSMHLLRCGLKAPACTCYAANRHQHAPAAFWTRASELRIDWAGQTQPLQVPGAASSAGSTHRSYCWSKHWTFQLMTSFSKLSRICLSSASCCAWTWSARSVSSSMACSDGQMLNSMLASLVLKWRVCAPAPTNWYARCQAFTCSRKHASSGMTDL